MSDRPGPQARAGVDVRARDFAGNVLARTTTGPDGSFVLSPLAPGLVLIEFDSPGAPTVAATAVNNSTIALGQSFPISRDAAFTAASTPLEVLVLGTMNPLPAGTTLGDEADALHFTLSAPAWLFFLDPYPDTYFEHEVQFVLVDATTGAVTRLVANSWPWVNNFRTWSDSNLDHRSSSPEVVQAGTTLPRATTEPPIAARLSPPAPDSVGNQNTFAILYAGYDESGITNARSAFRQLLLDHHVPEGNIKEPNVFKKDLDQAVAAVDQAVLEVANVTRTLSFQGKPSTVIVHIASHGRGAVVNGTPEAFFLAEGDGQSRANFKASIFIDRLEALRSSRLIVVNDHCVSGRMCDQAILGLAATRQLELLAGGTDAEKVADEVSGSFSKMLWFTKRIVQNGRVVDGKLEGILSNGAYLANMTVFKAGDGNLQHPTYRQRGTFQPILESFSPTSGNVSTTVTLHAVNLAHGFRVFFQSAGASQNVQATVVNVTPDDLGAGGNVNNVTVEVKVPAGAVTGPILLVNQDGQESVNSLDFIIESGDNYTYTYTDTISSFPVHGTWAANGTVTTSLVEFQSAQQFTSHFQFSHIRRLNVNDWRDSNGQIAPTDAGTQVGNGVGGFNVTGGRQVRGTIVIQPVGGSGTASVNPFISTSLIFGIQGTLDGDTLANSTTVTGNIVGQDEFGAFYNQPAVINPSGQIEFRLR